MSVSTADPSSPPGDPGTPAATVVPLRDGDTGLEVLLLRRNDRGPFGGMWVFPGGTVEAVDRAGAIEDGPAEGPELAAARLAAVREAEEEARLRLNPMDLVVHSYWVPPPETARRFLTWFFLAPVSVGGVIAVDQAEIHEHRWFRPSDAISRRDAGEIALAPPTWMTLWWLTAHAEVAAALDAARAAEPVRWATRAGLGSDGQMVATMWDGDIGYGDGDLVRAGRRRRLWLDPAGWRVEMDD